VVVAWAPEAELRLKKVPFFVRRMVRSAVEGFARKQGMALVTPELMSEVRRTTKRQ
jgi:hypothetical protein